MSNPVHRAGHPTVPGSGAEPPWPSRRTVLRGALLGVLGLSGLAGVACADDEVTTAGGPVQRPAAPAAAPPPEPTVAASTAPPVRSKSDVYRRGPEPRAPQRTADPARSAEPARSADPARSAEPAGGSESARPGKPGGSESARSAERAGSPAPQRSPQVAQAGESPKPAPAGSRPVTESPGVAPAKGTRRQGANPTTPETSSARPPGAPLARTSEIPVGGGKVLVDEKIVITQPVRGRYRAFSARCTADGCLVDSVERNTITCPCDGSAFSAEDGAVGRGPAADPLPPEPITVVDGEIRRA